MLWCGREFGRAAVMVGSGMSLNADKARASAPRFALWKDLARTMHAELHGVPAASVSETPDPVRTATEYEHVFKRAALDELLSKSIPDLDYVPGRLHRLLLALPWSDVFTTNYDTLLERTLPAVHDRKYDLINTVRDLVGQMKPRIVKLHGSFPSHRPFIITSEDYRTYPRKHAPFVNTVQQSIMENAFCLVGFSGDDPNFAAWAGWVRDNLGESAPPIYLAGLLDLSWTARTSLERGGVTPIDLAPLFPKKRWSDPAVRHALALEWLLLSLANGGNANPDAWPDDNYPPSSGGASSSPDLPALLPEDEPRRRRSGSLGDGASIHDLVAYWSAERIAYPGWLLCPESNRNSLSLTLQLETDSALSSINELNPNAKIEALYELTWRIDRALLPPPEALLAAVEATLESAAQLLEHHSEQSDTETSTDSNETDSPIVVKDWVVLCERWIFLAFFLMRAARERGDDAAHERWAVRIGAFARNRPASLARLHHERCLFHLGAFEQMQLRKALESWPRIPGMPFWDLRRASILAELGDLSEARQLAEIALDQIRVQSRPHDIDYDLMSQEGVAMVVARTLAFADRRHVHSRTTSRQRWTRIESYDCNPEETISDIHAELNRKRSAFVGRATIKNFDPGSYTYSETFSSETVAQPAYQLLRALEEASLPLRCGTVAQYGRHVSDAVSATIRHWPVWTFSMLIRAGEGKQLKSLFNREFIATLDDATRHILVTRCTSALRELLEPKHIFSGRAPHAMDSLSWRVAEGCCELLSRLTVVMSKEERQTTLDLACRLYELDAFSSFHQLHEPVGAVMRRVLEVSSTEEVAGSLLRLLELPIPGTNGFRVAMEQWWPDPFHGLETSQRESISIVRNDEWARMIRRLLRTISEGEIDARDRAVERVNVLHKLGVLSEDEVRHFGEALWVQLNPNSELPLSRRFLPCAWLGLPGAKEHNARDRFIRFALVWSIPVWHVVEEVPPFGTAQTGRRLGVRSQAHAVHFYLQTMTNGSVYPWTSRKFAERRVQWSSGQADTLLSHLERWMAAEVRVRKEYPSAPDREHEAPMLDEIASYAAYILGPAIGTGVRERLTRLLHGLQAFGACTLASLPSLASTGGDAHHVIEELRSGIAQGDERIVGEATKGILYWNLLSSAGIGSAPPTGLLREVLGLLALRRIPGLRGAISCALVTIELSPQSLDEDCLQSMLVGLTALLPDTRISEDVESDFSSASPIPRAERLEYRRLGAELAGALDAYFRLTGVPQPSVIADWYQAIEADPLPEMKKAWVNGHARVAAPKPDDV